MLLRMCARHRQIGLEEGMRGASGRNNVLPLRSAISEATSVARFPRWWRSEEALHEVVKLTLFKVSASALLPCTTYPARTSPQSLSQAAEQGHHVLSPTTQSGLTFATNCPLSPYLVPGSVPGTAKPLPKVRFASPSNPRPLWPLAVLWAKRSCIIFTHLSSLTNQ